MTNLFNNSSKLPSNKLHNFNKYFKEYSNRKNKKLKEAIKTAQRIMGEETTYEGNQRISIREELRKMENKLEKKRKKNARRGQRESDIDYEEDAPEHELSK